ncbi:MAG: type-F conjugative transfer system secretin TraK [Rhodospirillaceae bacterium]|nr:type-F conjugative transfer system secretin TraK [Rhodospirillaceae bacterium]
MQLACVALPMPAAAMQLLEAADHAELTAEISATEVNRIALIGDRVARVVRAPDGYAVEHDAATGDLWLRRVDGTPSTATPVTLFLGTEKGFTYRLRLTPSDRDAAQILIRNPRAMPQAQSADDSRFALASDPHIVALVKLVRSVARREPPTGYEILAGTGVSLSGVRLIETWRGPRFRALVMEADPLPSASGGGSAGLAGTIGESLAAGRVAALWLAAPGSGPTGGRLAVAVVETARTETPR